ncbi:uncharacterized protein F5891DRAFT_1195607 [Suillus fuscotomentosus]|uniref:F-box domain-containing protein n=1 Tax=Suillus fuscotomentosus TaxID=1912939 RepID=A0AAD4DUL5_9AGAM|nr:uncharacterized protein F5891DRAFT_1195607 [Suillus fuscotomentosus]KAG1894052.1 hypothetical protein F5891DRAFT_1195607 [Suillus fuscotomentosus]
MAFEYQQHLPNEVLSKIFHEALLPLHDMAPCYDHLDDLSLSSRLLEAPLLLTKICRRWRDIAVGMPSLWCRLLVKVECGDWQRRAVCYDTWLKRSQGRPVSLALLWPDFTSDSAKLRNLLQPYIHQITSLTVDFYDFPWPIGPYLFTGFVAVERLSARIADDLEHEVSTPIACSASQLPALRSFYFEASYRLGLGDLESFDPMWRCLTEVSVDASTHDSILYLLQVAPDLSSLTIDTYLGDEENLEPFMHAKLRFLCLHVDTLSDLLNALSLPNLCILEVHGLLTWPHDAFTAFLARSGCSLESLIVSGAVTITNEQRAEYISLSPSLQFP